MDTRLALFSSVIFAVLVFGCIGEGMPLDTLDSPPAPVANLSSSFTLPKSPVAYVAHYRVTDGTEESEKTIYRMDDRMRVDIGSGGAVQLSLYFAGGRAYSCPRFASGACFDITSNMASGNAALFSHGAMPPGAKFDSKTDIGGTVGSCYVSPYNIYGSRKVCYTDRGVPAYDEFPLGEKEMHVEYATSIDYGATETDFIFSVAK